MSANRQGRRGLAGLLLSNAGGACLVVVLSIAVYLNSLPGAFLLDDLPAVQNNPLVNSFSPVEIFSSDYWAQSFTSGLYRPVTIFSLSLNRLLLGGSPLSFHAVNMLLHAVVGCLFFFFVNSLGFGRRTSLVAASLFAVNPIHGEVVNLVVGRSELLAALFIFAGLLADHYLPKARLGVVPLLAALAFLSKESGIAIVGLIPLADAYRKGSVTLSLRERWPFFLFLFMLAVLWRIGVAHLLPGDALVFFNTESENPLIALSLLSRMLTALKVQLLYILDTLVPNRLSLVYDSSNVGIVRSLFSTEAIAVLSVCGLVVAAGIWSVRRRGPLGFALPFYVISAAPTSNLAVVIALMMAERFAYLPSAGVALAFAGCMHWTYEKVENKRLLRGGIAIVLAAYGIWTATLTVERNRIFSSPVALGESVTRLAPNSGRSWLYLGAALRNEGLPEEAEEAYLAGARVDPEFSPLWNHLANLAITLGKPREALHYVECFERYSGITVPTLNMVAADAHLQLGEPRAALARLEAVRSAAADDVEFQGLMGLSLEALGDIPGSIGYYKNAYGKSDNPEIAVRLARILVQFDAGGAELVCRTALEKWDLAELNNVMGISLALQNKVPEAVFFFRKAVSLDRNSKEYAANLSKAMLLAGEPVSGKSSHSQ